MKMINFFIALALVVIACGAAPASAANDNVLHYACKSGDDHYALTVHPNIIKLQEQAPPHTLTTFRILKEADPFGVGCGKGGWVLSGGVTFCYATQGYGSFTWHGHEFICDQADTE
jgi:hypothetical protein